MVRPRRLTIGAMLFALAFAQPAAAQTATPADSAPPASPTSPAPATPPSSSPPAVILQQAPAPGAAKPAVPSTSTLASRPTLIPNSGDTSNVDEVVLPEKPVLILSGTSVWDDGLKNLRAAFGTIEAELARLGIPPAGRPLAVFVQTTDDNFRFDAMVPVGAAPSPVPGLGPEMRFGVTPSGKAYRFVHKGPYDDIDTTYETITTYLDAKDILAKDSFIEEYVNDVADQTDPALEINIFVQPR